MTQTEQQRAFVEAVQRAGAVEHLAAIARAGSGKTTTMVNAARGCARGTQITMCAFNKRIADELSDRLAGYRNITARTLHGIGYRAVVNRFGRREVTRTHERDLAERIIGEPDVDESVLDAIAAIAVLAKEVSPLHTSLTRLMELGLEFDHAGDEDDDHGWDLARRVEVASLVLTESCQVGASISYSDMLYLPLVLGLRPAQTELVFVDEAQDMNAAQHRLARLVCRGRMVLVGDPRQAIYSWRGASPGGLEAAAAELSARTFALTITWRCARAIVAEAQRIVPDLECAPDAEDGAVSISTVPELEARAEPGDLVLSRTNAPLVSLCLKFLRRGVRAHILGVDAGKAMMALVLRLSRRVGGSLERFITVLVRWTEKEIARANARKSSRRAFAVADQTEAILAIAEHAGSISRLIAWLEDMFAGPAGLDAKFVTLSTIHRAKGMEADRVWVLQQTLDDIAAHPDADAREEANLRYVAITRARRELIWVQP